MGINSLFLDVNPNFMYSEDQMRAMLHDIDTKTLPELGKKIKQLEDELKEVRAEIAKKADKKGLFHKLFPRA